MMNPPRRRRASLQGTFGKRCRCAECEAVAAGADSASMRAMAGEISAVGWSVRTAQGDEFTPPWAYTVGLWQTRQGPELLMAGLPPEHMTIILNVIADRVADGIRVDVADEITGICPCSLTIRPVHPSWRETSMLAISDRYYGYVRPRYLQVVWPDRRGRYPGDRGFQTRYEGRQPMLWLPVEDHPPCTWTRLDVAC
ncbi:MAG TPA: DUF4262 domain-containing protein [Streptosporangiaceae bacterium]|nr:DUF4262 domain-containing protein [Streptosporangiaceae bacterium]